MYAKNVNVQISIVFNYQEKTYTFLHARKNGRKRLRMYTEDFHFKKHGADALSRKTYLKIVQISCVPKKTLPTQNALMNNSCIENTVLGNKTTKATLE